MIMNPNTKETNSITYEVEVQNPEKLNWYVRRGCFESLEEAQKYVNTYKGYPCPEKMRAVKVETTMKRTVIEPENKKAVRLEYIVEAKTLERPDC